MRRSYNTGGGSPVPVTNGVWIKYTDGSCTPYNDLDASKTPVGVALITDNVQIVIHPNNLGPSPMPMAYGAGAYATRNQAEAIVDYGGKTNTEAILAVSPSGPVQVAHDAVYADGSVGWLPSAGELYEIMLNITNINSALTLIGGDKIGMSNTPQYNYYWTSTYCSTSVPQSYWEGYISNGGMSDFGPVRATQYMVYYFRSITAF